MIPETTDMIVFRENSEDIYAGIEFEANSDEATKLIDFLTKEMNVKNIRFEDIVELDQAYFQGGYRKTR